MNLQSRLCLRAECFRQFLQARFSRTPGDVNQDHCANVVGEEKYYIVWQDLCIHAQSDPDSLASPLHSSKHLTVFHRDRYRDTHKTNKLGAIGPSGWYPQRECVSDCPSSSPLRCGWCRASKVSQTVLRMPRRPPDQRGTPSSRIH